MPDPATIDRLRATRNDARARFDTTIEQMKPDFTVHSVSTRLTNKLTGDAKATAAYALDIARENKGVVAGTLAAIALWFLRNPIIAWIERHFGDEDRPKSGEDNLED